jgi:hypothetical protein
MAANPPVFFLFFFPIFSVFRCAAYSGISGIAYYLGFLKMEKRKKWHIKNVNGMLW